MGKSRSGLWVGSGCCEPLHWVSSGFPHCHVGSVMRIALEFNNNQNF